MIFRGKEGERKKEKLTTLFSHFLSIFLGVWGERVELGGRDFSNLCCKKMSACVRLQGKEFLRTLFVHLATLRTDAGLPDADAA